MLRLTAAASCAPAAGASAKAAGASGAKGGNAGADAGAAGTAGSADGQLDGVDWRAVRTWAGLEELLEVDLVCGTPRHVAPLDTAVSLNLGFGGSNAALVFGRWHA